MSTHTFEDTLGNGFDLGDRSYLSRYGYFSRHSAPNKLTIFSNLTKNIIDFFIKLVQPVPSLDTPISRVTKNLRRFRHSGTIAAIVISILAIYITLGAQIIANASTLP